MTQPFILATPPPAPGSPSDRVRRWTPAVLTQLVVVLAVLVAGVTGAVTLRDRDSSKDVLSVVQAASTSAASAKSFRVTFTMSIKVGGQHIKGTGDLLADQAASRSSGHFEFPGLGSVSIVQVGTRGYFQVPNGGADALGHHWLSVNLPGASAQTALGGQDPVAMLKLLAKPEGVSKIGHDKIGGHKTTHYRVKIDPQRAIQDGARVTGMAVPPGTADALKNLGMDVWIDNDNLPRRMVMDVKSNQGSFRFSADLSDYGTRVTVIEPAPSDVTTVANMAELGSMIVGLRRG